MEGRMTDEDDARRRMDATLRAGWTRREFHRAALALGVAAALPIPLPARARSLTTEAARVRGANPGPVAFDLAIRPERVEIARGQGAGLTLNGTIPGPLIELYEGHEAVLRVTNHLDVDSSIHWHGILLPFEMDGVPGVAFPGIAPGATFEARFPVRQSGTYWYHSHSGLQEQSGVYGPLVVHPAAPDPHACERDYVLLLSDWTFEDPHAVLAKLEKRSAYYHYHQPTLGDLVEAGARDGWGEALRDRLAWGAMRMSPTDIADVTHHTDIIPVNSGFRH
jgi:CopA family copper-resistance protein